MNAPYTFSPTKNIAILNTLKQSWQASLTSPPDGMWMAFREQSQHWEIKSQGQLIGYANLNGEKQIIQFYVESSHRQDSQKILSQLLQATHCEQGIVGTNNPIFLSAALHLLKTLRIHTYLFRDHHPVKLSPKSGHLEKCSPPDLPRLVAFCEESVGAPAAWLQQYLGNLINRQEVFAFYQQEDLIGTCEVRTSPISGIADIGMIVSPSHRRKGYGSYLLHQAKTIALDRGLRPICSCEQENVGSLRAIHNSGFISTEQLLHLEF